MTIAVQIIAIIFMLTLIFIGIWSFIIANKAYSQLKYKNYLLEKIASQLAISNEKFLNEEIKTSENKKTKETSSIDQLPKDDEFYFEKQEILNEVTPLLEIDENEK